LRLLAGLRQLDLPLADAANLAMMCAPGVPGCGDASESSDILTSSWASWSASSRPVTDRAT
jgi:hypothetical protein